MFLACDLALSALSSDRFLSTNPSPLHSEHIPEPPQSSQTFTLISTCVEESEDLVLFTRRVAAAATRVAVTATEAAVSGNAKDTVDNLLP